MHVTPAGFTFLPGTERPGGGVFEVERDGVAYVCKRLPPRALAEVWTRARLEGEGALLGHLDGRGAPRRIAQGMDGAGPWIVLERVAWATLGARGRTAPAGVKATAGLGPGWVGRAAAAAFEALAEIHGAGVVHGDVSPDNVLVADDGSRAVLVDFGLATGPGMPPPPPGPFRGTLAFAAPEVARGEPSGARADVFGLAVTLLSVACGQPPRSAPSEAALLLSAAEDPVEPWARRAVTGLDPITADALLACCAFDPRQRPDRLGAGVPVP